MSDNEKTCDALEADMTDLATYVNEEYVSASRRRNRAADADYECPARVLDDDEDFDPDEKVAADPEADQPASGSCRYCGTLKARKDTYAYIVFHVQWRRKAGTANTYHVSQTYFMPCQYGIAHALPPGFRIDSVCKECFDNYRVAHRLMRMARQIPERTKRNKSKARGGGGGGGPSASNFCRTSTIVREYTKRRYSSRRRKVRT